MSVSATVSHVSAHHGHVVRPSAVRYVVPSQLSAMSRCPNRPPCRAVQTVRHNALSKVSAMSRCPNRLPCRAVQTVRHDALSKVSAMSRCPNRPQLRGGPWPMCYDAEASATLGHQTPSMRPCGTGKARNEWCGERCGERCARLIVPLCSAAFSKREALRRPSP